MKTKLKSIQILIALLLPGFLPAATKIDFATVDQLTYRFYLEKKWDSVIVIGKQALRNDIDYYYLRVRLGIAYFEKADYFPATTHLVRARKFNSEDSVVTNYLYYAYLYSNRQEEADVIRASMTDESRKSLDSKSGILQEVHAECGVTISSDRTPDNLATLMGNDSIYGEQDLYGNSTYTNLELKFRVSKRIGITAAYNYLGFNKTKYIQYGRAEQQLVSITDTSWGQMYNYVLPDPWVVHDTSFRYKVAQHELYLGASVAAGSGFRIMPAFHLIHSAYTMTTPAMHMDTIQSPWYYTSFDSTLYTFPFKKATYTYTQNDTSFYNYVAALQVTKDIGLFRIGLSGSWSNLNGKKQKQIGASLTCFPLGNLRLYGTTAVTGFFQGKSKRLLLSQVIGTQITPWMWGEADFYYGDYTNANIFNGSVVYNNSDIIDYRGGATLIFLAGKHLRISLTYQYFRKESQQYYYIKTQDPDTKEINEIIQTKNNPYNTNTLIGGITWKL